MTHYPLRHDGPSQHPTVIRRCTASDLEPLEWFGAYSDHRAIIREAFERQQRGEIFFLVADSGGFPVGQTWVDLTRKKQDGSAVVWAVRVLPSHRKFGLGRKLMEAAECLVKRRGFRYCELAVEKSNAAVIPFYERLGYRQAGDEFELWRYVMPDGTPVEQPLHLWVFRKELERA